MAKLALNKSALNRERKNLEAYRRFLPSLELKQRQLTALREKARREAARSAEELQRRQSEVAAGLPMLASDMFDLSGMVAVEEVKVRRENAVGVELPRLDDVRFRVQSYSLLGEPHWVDAAIEGLREVLELRIRNQMAERRLELLEDAVRKITQRVNLFTEVLIPRAEDNIRKISIYLGDLERAAVIRAKIAKKKREVDRREQGAAP
ncbi:MAG TPA: V-type ATP synthase subunit D [Myxococcales bacterium LLY-WYZ-16_1]|jgi:V/A-type H+/Na+-transporting ATPase subunit D|nr:V-type ATP synthase subunit D [Myxococcales bacterium LLY-WYZ-16_1]